MNNIGEVAERKRKLPSLPRLASKSYKLVLRRSSALDVLRIGTCDWHIGGEESAQHEHTRVREEMRGINTECMDRGAVHLLKTVNEQAVGNGVACTQPNDRSYGPFGTLGLTSFLA